MITSPTVTHIFDCDLRSDEMTLKIFWLSHTTMRSTSLVIRIFFAEWVKLDFSVIEDEVGCPLLMTGVLGVLGELVRADADGGTG